MEFGCRDFSADFPKAYCYAFNGMERDDDWKGTGNSYNFGARIYDPRIGRWLARDPKEAKYPFLSTYSFCANNPLTYMDVDGRDIKPGKNFRSTKMGRVFTTMRGYDVQKMPVFNSLIAPMVIPKEINGEMRTEYDLHLGMELMEEGVGGYTDGIGMADGVAFTKYNTLYEEPIYLAQGYDYDQFYLATDLFRALTIVHELVHIKLYVEGFDGHEAQSHEIMARPENRQLMASALLEFAAESNIELSKQDAAAMVWTGLTKTKAFEEKFGKKGERTADQQASYDEWDKKVESLTYYSGYKELTNERDNTEREFVEEPKSDYNIKSDEKD